MKSVMRPILLLNCLSFSVIYLLSIGAVAQTEDTFFEHTLKEEKKPWTPKPFYNNPDNFQFAIVSDRTGGHRKGVFGKGLEKINQLYPEFVMSVGDLIEGYTKDTTLLNEQWSEFHGILDSLETKFFYVAGNHDYSNSTMAAQWKERYGKDYYHFKYKDVLFLVVNSNDGDGVLMGEDQIAFLKQAIAQNTDVRWTMIFMHHPMWAYGEINGFDEVENALKGRDYTVFAGHTHRYLYEVRNDQNHYVLGTTGGGSKLRGPKFGEFDHVGWVTMTDDGPKLVNLSLSGILGHDISTKQTATDAKALVRSADLRPLVLSKGLERKIVLVLNNPSGKALHFEGHLFHHHQVEPDSTKFKIDLQPNSTHVLNIKTRPTGSSDVENWDPLELEWGIGYDKGFMEPEFSLGGKETIELNTTSANTEISFTEQDIFFKDHKVYAEHPYGNENLMVKYTLDGTEPSVDSQSFPDRLDLMESSEVRANLVDAEGFKSGTVIKEFKKVTPLGSVKVRNPKKGMGYAYYEDNFTTVPDFNTLGAPTATGVALELDPDKIGKRLDHYAIQYKGFIEIPKTGIYTFYVRSDDGSKLFVDDELIVDNDGSHDAETRKGFVALKKGWHAVRIDYFEDFLGELLEVEYSGEGMEKKPVDFWH